MINMIDLFTPCMICFRHFALFLHLLLVQIASRTQPISSIIDDNQIEGHQSILEVDTELKRSFLSTYHRRTLA